MARIALYKDNYADSTVVVQVYADFATRLSLNFLTLMPLIPCIGFAGTPWAVFADAAH